MKKYFLLLFLFSFQLQAAPICSDLFTQGTNYLFGLEFTFTNQRIIDEGNRNPKDFGLATNPLKAAAWEKWLEIVKEKCKVTSDCTTYMSEDKHGAALAVRFKDNFQITIGIDSAALEVNATPKIRSEFADVKKHMEDYVFATALEAGLKPHERAGQGHIHISTKAFTNGLDLRNFFVDFQNRPEIIYGALGNHLLNSPPLAAQSEVQRNQLAQVLNQLDAGGDNYTVRDFANLINSQVYTDSVAKDWGSPTYYQAFNMTRVNYSSSKATVEIRSFRPQASPDIFELQTMLLERWVERLKQIDKPIPYINKDKYEYSSQEIVNGFHQLIIDLELPWKTFKVLLPEKYQHIQPNEKFKSVNYSIRQMLKPPAMVKVMRNFFSEAQDLLKSWF